MKVAWDEHPDPDTTFELAVWVKHGEIAEGYPKNVGHVTEYTIEADDVRAVSLIAVNRNGLSRPVLLFPLVTM